MAATKEIKTYRGNSVSLKLAVTDASGEAFDLGTYKARFCVAKTVEDTPLIDLDTDNDPDSIYFDPNSSNAFFVHVAPSHTASMAYTYKYTAEVFKGEDDERYTVAFGNFVVQDDGVA